ncbi:MAG: hypothetical protein ACP5N6_13945 [Anaerolineae bacterium]
MGYEARESEMTAKTEIDAIFGAGAFDAAVADYGGRASAVVELWKAAAPALDEFIAQGGVEFGLPALLEVGIRLSFLPPAEAVEVVLSRRRALRDREDLYQRLAEQLERALPGEVPRDAIIFIDDCVLVRDAPGDTLFAGRGDEGDLTVSLVPRMPDWVLKQPVWPNIGVDPAALAEDANDGVETAARLLAAIKEWMRRNFRRIYLMPSAAAVLAARRERSSFGIGRREGYIPADLEVGAMVTCSADEAEQQLLDALRRYETECVRLNDAIAEKLGGWPFSTGIAEFGKVTLRVWSVQVPDHRGRWQVVDSGRGVWYQGREITWDKGALSQVMAELESEGG